MLKHLILTILIYGVICTGLVMFFEIELFTPEWFVITFLCVLLGVKEVRG